jgi:hypothetical protein
MLKKSIIAFVTLACSLSALAGEIVIPAVYRGPGAYDSSWRTELVVANVSPITVTPFHVTTTLHRPGQPDREIRSLLSSMETYAIHDVVHDWFDLEQGGGLVRITWPEGEGRVAARARIYNLSTAGEYGQNVPGRALDTLVTDHYLTGIDGANGNRTNIGISNPYPTEHAMVWIELLDSAGETHGAFTRLVEPRGWIQIDDIHRFFEHAPRSGGMIRVTAVNMPVYAYASIVRNDTGDATFVVTP